MSTHIINFPGADIHTTTITSVSNVSVGENLDVASNLTVSGNTAVSQELSVSGNVEVGTANLFVDTTTGNVGVGVAHPMSAKLQVAGSLGMAKGSEFFAGDDVVMELPKHDRPLVKYPEVAMTAATTAGYTVDASRYGASYDPFKAFNGLKGGSSGDVGWHTGTATPPGISDYTGTNNTYVGTERLSSETVLGEWITIELPNPIKLIDTHLWAQFNYAHVPKGGVFYGKRNASDTWTQLYSYTGQAIVDRYHPQVHTINETRYFKYFAYVATERYLSASGISVGEWELYGTEEGDTSVDVVHRSIPNKPGQQHLEVYWDANDSNSYSFADSSNVYDLSGNGRMGTLTNGVGFDSEYNAFTFDGVNDVVTGVVSNHSLKSGYSMATWINPLVMADEDYIAVFGVGNIGTQIGINFDSSNALRAYIYGSGTLGIVAQTSDNYIRSGEWIHVAATYVSGTGAINLYINDKLAATGLGTSLTSISSSAPVIIGARDTNGTIERHANFKMANFRLFGKVLNADQVRELYEYDAPRFGHRQNLVSLHKGNLGVGVSHPTSRFEVAGTETLQEYPPKAMTGYETYIEGHGVFRASASTVAEHPYLSFNKNFGDVGYTSYYDSTSTNPTYSNVTGAYNLSVSTNGILGEWIGIEFPYEVKLSSFVATARPSYYHRFFKDYTLLGSSNEVEWHVITSGTGNTNTILAVSVNESRYFTHYRLIAQKIGAGNSIDIYACLNFAELQFFGTPAPSGLEDGHLTLGKALTLPRVSGHPAGAETPRAESLVVHYDTTVDSVVSGSTVVDVSGNGINGTLTNGAAYSSTDRALTFDGTDDYIIGNLNNSGDTPFTVSLWLKTDASGVAQMLWNLGGSGGTGNPEDSVALEISSSNGLDFFIYSGTSEAVSSFGTTYLNKWVHVVATRSGNTLKIYFDGTQQTTTTFSSTDTLSLVANTEFTIGARGTGQLGNSPLNGSISNFKLWNVALTASEVRAEYALGRTGKALNVTDTSLCLGGTVPRAQLDVRGSARFGGIMSYSVPYYFAQQENTGSYAYDEPIVYKTNVVTNYPGSFYSSATNNGYYIPPLPGVYQVHMTAIANGAGNIYIQKFNYVTDSVILYHDKTHFSFTSGGWESISASGLISIDDPGTQAIRIFADGSSGNGIWAYNSYHGCVSIVWVSNI